MEGLGRISLCTVLLHSLREERQKIVTLRHSDELACGDHTKSARYCRLETRRNGLRPMLSVLPRTPRQDTGLTHRSTGHFAAVQVWAKKS